MDKLAPYIGMGALLAGGLAVQFVLSRRRHGRDYRIDLEPILKAHGLAFVSARWPGMFRVGPFPKFEMQFGRPQSHVMGISGEYDEYRIVTVRDSEGNEHELWAMLEFEVLRLRRIRWRAEKGQDLPSEARRLLEN